MAYGESPYIQHPHCEPVFLYAPGQYHPIDIGDIFKGRYVVKHRLGHGAYATIWLVWDSIEARAAALKVIVARESFSTSELAICRHLAHKAEAVPGADFIAEMIDHFEVEGPNGRHLCLVMELLGPSLELLLNHKKPPFDVCARMITQISRAVAYLHFRGVVHGDLHPGNILLKIPGSESWLEQDLDLYFGPPLTFEIQREDNEPLTVDDSIHLPAFTVQAFNRKTLLTHCLANPINIKIIDFGKSFFNIGEAKSRELGIPRYYAAPEVLLKEPVNSAMDVWALAALQHMTYCRLRPLFGSEYEQDIDSMLGAIVYHLGKFPDKWWLKWDRRLEYWDETRQCHINRLRVGYERQFLKPDPSLPVAHKYALELLARMMVRYEPEKRISAATVAAFLESWDPGRAGIVWTILSSIFLLCRVNLWRGG
ncbi:hypothetical protein CVT26_006299 [Gymnopilus dilepis]|uniref:non-specific serine/threonine protein kinase n=1 Tax=Gymnopilus dilepis TaxID=231916 RepID=A0A409Y0N4_9AGAR|nr:hypothetical protein CVT26_006299 [Gymnopilus dilepis]